MKTKAKSKPAVARAKKPTPAKINMARQRGAITAAKAGDGNRKGPPRVNKVIKDRGKSAGFDAGRAIGAAGKGIGDAISGIPGAINGVVRGLNGGPGVVNRAMTKK